MLKNSLISIAATLLLAACSSETAQPEFTFDGTVEGHDGQKAYLYVLLPEYQELMAIDSAKIKSGAFHFEGTVDKPMEAIVKMQGDSVICPFVLTNNQLAMQIESGTYSVQGSQSNNRLSAMLAERTRFDERRDDLQKEYKRHIADTTLTRILDDSLALAYQQAGVDYRKRLLTHFTRNAEHYPVMCRTALRIFSKDLYQSQADSVLSLLSNQKK